MNLPLGYALLRDRRVSVRSKLTALTVGLAFTGLVELLQLPFESVFALLLPVAGAAGESLLTAQRSLSFRCSWRHCLCPISRLRPSSSNSAPNARVLFQEAIRRLSHIKKASFSKLTLNVLFRCSLKPARILKRSVALLRFNLERIFLMARCLGVASKDSRNMNSI